MKALISVQHNIIANFAGSAWTSLISLVFIPFFIKLIGVEAYGLMGIFASLTALFAILDMGLSSTLSRELSRLSAREGSEQEARDLVRTLEVVYWGVGILIGMTVVVMSPLIAHHWVTPLGVPAGTVETAIMIMGLSVAFHWPSSLYTGGLMGLQRQVLLNVVRVVVVTIQYGGAVLLLWLVSPTILTFFVWQFVIGIVNTIVLTVCLWNSLPESGFKASFDVLLLRKNWRFAAGMTGISALVTILTQLDKIILSKMLNLELFGYYVLALSVATTLNNLVTPIFSALYPKFSQVIAEGEELKFSRIYHNGCQLLAIIVLPAAVTLAIFSKSILSIWLQSPETVQKTYFVLTLLVCGTTINALMTLPYTAQLAHGWTRLSLIKNVIAAIFLVPLMVLMVKLYGATGAATVWIILNFGYLIAEIPIMHRRILKDDMWTWYIKDVGLPLLACLLVIMLSKCSQPETLTRFQMVAWITATVAIAMLSAALCMSTVRSWFKKWCVV